MVRPRLTQAEYLRRFRANLAVERRHPERAIRLYAQRRKLDTWWVEQARRDA